MSKIRTSVVVLAAAGAIVAGAPVTEAQPIPSSPQVSASCKRATIGGRRKCIAAGQYCSRSHQRDYKRYGYSCSRRDSNGKYHLVRL
jgi:hypothetical protein